MDTGAYSSCMCSDCDGHGVRCGNRYDRYQEIENLCYIDVYCGCGARCGNILLLPLTGSSASTSPSSGHARQKSVTMEDTGGVKRGSVALVYRKTGVQFMVESAVQADKSLQLSPKMKGFDYSRIVDLLKVNLSSRDAMGNINDSNVYSSASFLVSLNLLVREEIFHQLELQNVGPDDISPLLVNCFILAMVGLSRISLEIFELMDKYVGDLSDIDTAIIDNHRALAAHAFDWCVANKYVDKPLTCDASVKIKIALYGFVATGKTSILFRYIDNEYTGKTMSTIGVDFRQKKLTLDIDGSRVTCLVDVWDTAGQEKYRAMTSNFVKGMSAENLLLSCQLLSYTTEPWLPVYDYKRFK